MQRWNDKLRPVELVELDKQAHKMIIAYFLGKFHEQDPGFNWLRIIEGGLFEFLQRIVVTDLKPQIVEKIRSDTQKYEALNTWVYRTLQDKITPLGPEFCRRFREYFSDPRTDINRRILNAAHFAATQWEFEIILRENPRDYEIDAIRLNLQEKQARFQDLYGMRILGENIRYQNFVSLCGQLRFQIRWSRVHRVPRTSVLGHMLFVAIFAYLFSLSTGSSDDRCRYNYFTGLFHDLPEALTRDIISPVKKSVEGLKELIKDYEHEEMRKVYRLLPDDPPSWAQEMRMFTEQEFENVERDGKRIRDGELVEAADKFAAYLEAYEAIRNGSPDEELRQSRDDIQNTWSSRRAAGMDFGRLYAQFAD